MLSGWCAYARPSVYFEAGYAQRAINVIYTVGSDHFKEHDDDAHGNRHVHFDLKMRNIIGWSSPKDRSFPQRLCKRITALIAPIIKTKRESDSRAERRATFDRLSLVEKQRTLFDSALSHFKRARYKTLDLRHDQTQNLTTPFFIHSSMRPGAFVATKRLGARFRFVYCQSLPAISTKLGRAYYLWLAFPPYARGPVIVVGKPPAEIVEDILIISLGSGGLKRLHKELPSSRPGQFDNTLTYETNADFSTSTQKVPSITRHMTFHVFESTHQLARLSEILTERFARR